MERKSMYPDGVQLPPHLGNVDKDATDYERLLNTWEWRHRAMEIKERDGYRCQQCERTIDLEVHHKKYTTTRPWLELGTNLITLCSICHHAEGREKFNSSIPTCVSELVRGLIKEVEKPIHPQENKKFQAQLQWASEIVRR